MNLKQKLIFEKLKIDIAKLEKAIDEWGYQLYKPELQDYPIQNTGEYYGKNSYIRKSF